MQQQQTAIVWFTNNLRINDNKVLEAACNKHDQVLGVYFFDDRLFKKTPYGFKKTERFRAQFLIESVNGLKQNLDNLNISLFTIQTRPHCYLPELCEKYNVKALYVQKEFTPEEEDEILKVKSALPTNMVVHEYYDQFLYHPEDLSFHVEQLPEIFTSFRKIIESNAPRTAVSTTLSKKANNSIENHTQIPSLSDLGFESFEIPITTAFPFSGGENSAKERIQEYFFDSKKLSFYKKTRNGLIGKDYSSKLSSWLANGCISARKIYWAVRDYEKEFGSNESTYWLIFELIWRDYFKYVSLKHRTKLFKLSGIKERSYAWNTDPKLISQWINGKTPEPFVNANMIELKQTGWMSNRGRQNVASYFAKSLGLDWRIGAAYFESMLIDYDVHSNYGNWQYLAGVGNDSRDRIFNVKLQAERYDINGKYQKLWLQPSLF
jgi:deoxyribodipyrimidine photo-lyase